MSGQDMQFLRSLAEKDPEAAAVIAQDDRIQSLTPPEIDGAWHWLWRAWQRLTHERPWRPAGMGDAFPGRIPWTALRSWAQHHRMGEDDMETLVSVVEGLDDEFLAFHREKAAKA